MKKGDKIRVKATGEEGEILFILFGTYVIKVLRKVYGGEIPVRLTKKENEIEPI